MANNQTELKKQPQNVFSETLSHITKVLMKYLFIQLGVLYQVIQGFFIYLTSSKPNILILRPINVAEKIIVFAVYRKNFDKTIDLTLVNLKQQGFKIILVSNCSLNKDFINRLKSTVNIVIQRSNYGRCFAAYKTGFLFLKEKNFYTASNILFMNDTTIFPLFNPKNFWKEINSCKADIVGVYSSNEFFYHVQSFFIYCKNGVFEHPKFIHFWESYLPFNSKSLIIKYGELGFSKMCIGAGFKIHNFINGSKINKCFNNSTKIDKNYFPSPVANYSGSIVDLFRSQHNTSHAFGLIAPIFFDLPLIKTDLLSADSFTQKQIIFALKKKIRKNLFAEVIVELNRKMPKKNEKLLFTLKKFSGII
jgi:hypothetical protein